MTQKELKAFLDLKVAYYNQPHFIASDPLSIPHQFSKKEDIEIAGFFAATLAWGQRVTIINNARRLMHFMDNAPHDFILNHRPKDLEKMAGFVHRTFNYDDLLFFIASLKNLYQNQNGLEGAFTKGKPKNALDALVHFRQHFFNVPHLPRSSKHVSNPLKNSSCKRLNMYLRWMVRPSNTGVDFGLWKNMIPAQLSCPLDVHSGNVARKLGLLKRTYNDWKAVVELDATLRNFDPQDPVKYDFALFGLGVFEKVKN
jgi:uncharacterized protein (TIGR02757 family)